MLLWSVFNKEFFIEIFELLGSSLFDLGKFIGMACDRECRERMKMSAFHAYYQELTFLYNSVNLDVPFNKEQVCIKIL